MFVQNNYERLASLLRDDLNENEIEQIYQVLCDMPKLSIKLDVIGSLHGDSDVFQHVKMPPNKDHWLQIHQNEEYTIQAKFHRNVEKGGRNKRNNEHAIPKVHCPKFSKVKDEGWFMILGDSNIGELLALKRCSYRNPNSYHSVTFTAPDRIGEWHTYFRSNLCSVPIQKHWVFSFYCRTVFIYRVYYI